MKLWQIIGLFVIGLLFLYRGQDQSHLAQRQEQQEDPRVMEESLERLSWRVVYQSASPAEDKLADIHWLKKAAALALQKGHPYFNVMEQRLIRSAKVTKGHGKNRIEGVIQLSSDPINAEYDAREISALIMTED